MKKIYVSDLDGTLLNEKGELSDETYEILKSLLNTGLLFTVASARPVTAIKRILRGLPISLPVISANGAYISNLHTLEHIAVNAMEGNSAKELVACSKEMNLNVFVSTYTKQGDKTYWNRFENSGQQKFVEERIANKDPRLTFTIDIEKEINNPVIMFMILDEKVKLELFIQKLSGQTKQRLDIHINEDVYDKDYCWLVATNVKATKHEAIKEILKAHALEGRELIVFGDQTNDISMMGLAHKSVAVANAVQAVKEIATEVIGKNTDNSVALYILEDNK